MILTITGLVVGAVSGLRPRRRATGIAGALDSQRPPDAEDYAPDAYRRRKDRFKAPTWLDQRKVLRNVNGVGGRWI
jgi:hypothetical protein